MKSVKIVLSMVAGTSLLFGAIPHYPQHFSLTPSERYLLNDWVSKCLEDFKTIKPNMTRLEITKRLIPYQRTGSPTLFPYSSGSLEAFAHPECPYFKIDIEFARGVSPSADDKIIKFSKPYLEGARY